MTDGYQVPLDEETLTRLYRDYVAMVYGYLRANGVAEPEDVTSEVFLSMVRSFSNFRGDEERFRAWLMTIAHHRLVDYRRRQRGNVLGLDEATAALVASTASPSIEPAILDIDLVDSLARLTPEQREVLALRYIADLSLETVAAITERTVGAVKSMQRRALESLRASKRFEDARRPRQ